MPQDFLKRLCEQKATAVETAVALLWRHSLNDHNKFIHPKQLADEMESVGFAKQNVSRLGKSLAKDARTAKGSNGTFKIKIHARDELEKRYSILLQSRPIKISDAIIPLELVKGSRRYIEKVTLQLNAGYEGGLYDCCAIMCRRLLETLIIEVYEYLGRAKELEGADGNFFMFSGLLNVLENDSSIKLSRSSMAGLKSFKKLGDLSAHSRRFNATKADIDKISSDVRVSVEELLHLAKLI